MASAFDLLVFDWDGTLLDSTGCIVASMQAACRDLELPEPSFAHASYVIGLGLADALRHSAPTLEPERFGLMIDRYKHHYLSRDRELSLFDGVYDLVCELKARGSLLAVATGKGRLGLDRALQTSGLTSFFAATRCADECFSKPHPQMLEELLDELQVAPERALMIGDTTHDLQMAQNAGVACVAVTYGAHAAEQLAAMAPLACLASVGELAAWLRAH